MRRLVFVICLAVCISMHSLAQSYGLQFNSHEAVPEKRTSLELVPGDSLRFHNEMQLDFDLNFIRGHEIYFGYVLRIINEHQNIDIIYDQPTSMFRLITGLKFSGISFSLDSAQLFNSWSKIHIAIDRSNNKIKLTVNNRPVGTANIVLKSDNYRFLWGANDYNNYQTRDIPPMRIKDIKLFDGGELKYDWALGEIKGTTSTDGIHKKTALAKNPVWIKPSHQNWAMVNAFVVKGNAVTAFDQKSELLYIAGSDSVLAYDVKSINNLWKKYPVVPVNILSGSQAVYDTLTNKLYDVFIDEKKVISYEPGSGKWNEGFPNVMETEYGHANKFISSLDTALYIIGGYGQLKYKNSVQRYTISGDKWETVETQGDFFPPRYLAALGLNATGDTAFIIGGYGSTTGNQMLNPGNYSDMYAFDVRSSSFKKLFSVDTAFSKYTFANSLVIDSKNQQFYGLIFQNDIFNSSLQLVQGSLKKPEIKWLGSSIPYSFYDRQSFVDLYYSPEAGKLVAVTLFGPKYESAEKFSTVKIYTLDFPPDPGAANEPVSPNGKISYTIIILSALALLITGFFVVRRRKPEPVAVALPVEEQKKEEAIITNLPVVADIMPHQEEKRHSSIFLFGQFQVFDRDGNDITELFTPLIKELFLLILIYSFKNGRGITSEELNEILWSTKSVKDAKNNRSVNLTKLKGIIEKVGDCAIAKKSNFWQFQAMNDSVYIDYVQFTHLVKEGMEPNKRQVKEILKHTAKGAFLFQTEYNWLDDIKAEISNSIIDICLNYINHASNIYEDPEFIIEIANTIFHFDRLNEDALEYKCKSLIYLKRHAIANKTYTKFVKDYKDMYGEEFEKTFTEIIKNDSHTPLKLG